MAVLLTPGLGGAAVLGGALHQPERPQPLPVFTANLAGIDGAAAQPPAVLVPLRHDTVTHTSLTAAIDPAELDRFLADMGEPVPDLDLYLLWTVVRSLSGGVDTLVDATPGRPLGAGARPRPAAGPLRRRGALPAAGGAGRSMRC